MRKFLMLFSVLMLGGLLVVSRSHTITGTVKDHTGTPAPHATVTKKGTRNAMNADRGGNFTLKMKGNNALILTAADYNANTVTPPNGNTVVFCCPETLRNSIP